ncbi:MAG: amino acid adenylation domain-containing protein [Acidobacteriota bacterium]
MSDSSTRSLGDDSNSFGESSSGPLTYPQTQIWTGQRLHPQSPLYNMAFAFVLQGEVRSEDFLAAWRRVAEGSDVLRTRIRERVEGSPERFLGPVPESTTLDLSSHPEPEAEFRRWCHERCARPLPLNGPLVDSVWVTLGPGRAGWYLNQHHVIADAWSTTLVYRQVLSQLKNELEGRLGADSSTGNEAVQSLASPPAYYPTAQALLPTAEESATKARQRAQEHWNQQQRRSPGTSQLYGRPLQPEGTESRRWTLALSEAQSRRLDQLAAGPGFRSLSPDLSRFALFATLLSAWLYRLGNSASLGEDGPDREGTELGFDTPVAGRPTAEAKRALGLFIELFPFRVAVEPGDSLLTLGARCLGESLQLLRHALPGTSGGQINTASGAQTSNVVLNYIPVSFGDFAGRPAQAEWVHPGHGDSVHALRLQVHDFSSTGSTVLHFDANEAALSPQIIQRGMEHFQRLLESVLEHPERPLDALDLLTPAERQQLQQLHSPTLPKTTEPAEPRTVVQLFEEQAARAPHSVALQQGTEVVSFQELQRQVEALASILRERGIQPGDRVALLGRRSTLTVVAVLAVLRIRAAYVPIDLAAPPTRREHLLRDSGARLLLLGELLGGDGNREDEGIQDDGLAAGVPTLAISSAISSAISQGLTAAGNHRDPTDELPPQPGPNELAYLLYTSGSTGLPKGVLVDHGALSTYLRWASETYVRGEALTFALFTSLAFDLTVTSLFLPLITGGTLEIFPESSGATDTAGREVARARGVDFVKLTPSHLELMQQVGLEGSGIRRMILGGEALRADLAGAVHQQLQQGPGIESHEVEIYNEYGPTEAIVGCVVHRFDPERDSGPGVPIGRPMDHVRAEILNAAGAPVPVGVPGELWIAPRGAALGGHDALAQGYQGLAALTADRFRPHPEGSGQRRYRTGDRVRLRQDGNLDYLGRLDRQLKIAGHRIEPGEIESALLAHSGIEQCAVLAHQPAPSAAQQAQANTTSPTGGEITIHRCTRCGLPSNYPGATFDDQGLCSVCLAYEATEIHTRTYFRSLDDLRAIFEESARRHNPPYDCIMLLSGGKDSSYALSRLVELGLKVYAFTLDNGFISEGAKENVRRVAAQLEVPVEFATTPAMNAIFRDSLRRFSNVCNGCFKTIYTLSTQRARELGIPIVVTGLSRGQMFETRLTEELFRDGRRSPEEIDAAVLSARKAYHRAEDEVSRSLDVGLFQDDKIFDEVRFVDFYRYCDVGLDEVYAHLGQTVPWIRPGDTGRSTNCLINDTGIFVHKHQRGFHNYALPYSWDVRLGHKTRDEALDELDDDIDEAQVRSILEEIDYPEGLEALDGAPSGPAALRLHAFYVSAEDFPEVELRQHLQSRLPAPVLPSRLHRLDSLPLTQNGKLDTDALLATLESSSSTSQLAEAPYSPPDGPVEEFLAEIWQDELHAERVGAEDHFFQLGGTSLTAIQVMLRLCREFDIDLPLDGLFTTPTLRALARVSEDRILADVGDF